jgi:hypothetical protein
MFELVVDAIVWNACAVDFFDNIDSETYDCAIESDRHPPAFFN